MRYRHYYVKRRGPNSASVISTGPYFSFLAWVGVVLSPLFAVAMLWNFWLCMFFWHWASGGIFLLIYAFIVGAWAGAIPKRAFIAYRLVVLSLLAVSPLLIPVGYLARA